MAILQQLVTIIGGDEPTPRGRGQIFFAPRTTTVRYGLSFAMSFDAVFTLGTLT